MKYVAEFFQGVTILVVVSAICWGAFTSCQSDSKRMSEIKCFELTKDANCFKDLRDK